MSRVEKYTKKRKKIRKVLAVVGSVIGIYVCGTIFFSTHFFPNTVVGDYNIGLKSRAAAKKYVEKALSDYTLTVKEPDREETITSQDAGLVCSDFHRLGEILSKQSAETWLLEVGKKHPQDAFTLQVDEEKLKNSLDTLQCMNPETPVEAKNASIQYDKEEKKFQIQKESAGNIVDKQLFLYGVANAFIAYQEEISLMEGDYYVKPTYTSESEEVIQARDTMNQYLGGTMTIADGEMKKKITKNDIQKFVKCSDTFEVSISRKKVKKYVKNNISKTFNSVEGDIPDGLTAWKVDEEKETDQIIEVVKSGKKDTQQPVYAVEGFDRKNVSIGKTYIDVNISKQHMWYVEDGKVELSSDIVTGNISTGHGTGTGFYRIAFKQRDHLMVKYNSFVHYWMPYNTTVGIGFHDASWRSSFGGQIYKTNGSHGCINMPPEKAAALYSLISTGTAVYVHY